MRRKPNLPSIDQRITQLLLDLRPIVSSDWQSRIDACLSDDPDHALRLQVGDAWCYLTPRQQDTLRAIWLLAKDRSYGPTLQEISDVLGTSRVSVFENLRALEAKGVLERTPHRARQMRIVRRTHRQMAGNEV